MVKDSARDFIRNWNSPSRRAYSIEEFISAWEYTELHNSQNYYELQEIYQMLLLDPTLRASWRRRKSKVMGESVVVSIKDEIDAKLTEALQNIPYLQKLISDILDARLFGYTYVQLFPEKYDLLDRRFCVPNYEAIVRSEYDTKYVPLKSFPDAYSFIGEDYWGDMLVVSFHVIMKRSNLQNFAQHNDDFGTPILVIKSARSHDLNQRQIIANTLREIKNNKLGVLNTTDVLESIDTASNSIATFTEFDRITKEEIQNFIEGQDFRMDNGRTYINETVANMTPASELQEQDMQYVSDALTTLLPSFVTFGFIPATANAKIEFSMQVEKRQALSHKLLTITQHRNNIYSMLLANGYKIPAEYFKTNYGIDVTEPITTPTEPITQVPKTDTGGNEAKTNKNDTVTKLQPKETKNDETITEAQKRVIVNLQETIFNPFYNQSEETPSAKDVTDLTEKETLMQEVTLVLDKTIELIEKGLADSKEFQTQIDLLAELYNTEFKFALQRGIYDELLESTKKGFEDNMLLFSKAKARQQLSELRTIGEILKGDALGEYAQQRNSLYAGYWQITEEQNANSVILETAKWESFIADGVTAVQYVSQKDERTRPEHRKLNGKVFAIDDPLLDKVFPPNGFGCRCDVIPASRKKPQKHNPQEIESYIDKGFAINFAKEKILFSPETSYLRNMNKRTIE